MFYDNPLYKKPVEHRVELVSSVRSTLGHGATLSVDGRNDLTVGTRPLTLERCEELQKVFEDFSKSDPDDYGFVGFTLPLPIEDFSFLVMGHRRKCFCVHGALQRTPGDTLQAPFKFTLPMEEVKDGVKCPGSKVWDWLGVLERPFVLAGVGGVPDSDSVRSAAKPAVLTSIDNVDSVLDMFPDITLEASTFKIRVPTVEVPTASGKQKITDTPLHVVMGINGGLYIIHEDGTRTFVPQGMLAMMVATFFRSRPRPPRMVSCVGLGSTSVLCGAAVQSAAVDRVAEVVEQRLKKAPVPVPLPLPGEEPGQPQQWKPHDLVMEAGWDTVVMLLFEPMCPEMGGAAFKLHISPPEGLTAGTARASALAKSRTWLLTEATMHRVVQFLSGVPYEELLRRELPPCGSGPPAPVADPDLISTYERTVLLALIRFRQGTAVHYAMVDPRWTRDVDLSPVHWEKHYLVQEVATAATTSFDMDLQFAKALWCLSKRGVPFLHHPNPSKGTQKVHSLARVACIMAQTTAEKPGCFEPLKGFTPWCVVEALLFNPHSSIKELKETYATYFDMLACNARGDKHNHGKPHVSVHVSEKQYAAYIQCLTLLLGDVKLRADPCYYQSMLMDPRTPDAVKPQPSAGTVPVPVPVSIPIPVPISAPAPAPAARRGVKRERESS